MRSHRRAARDVRRLEGGDNRLRAAPQGQGREGAEPPDHRRRLLLRAGDEGPSDSSASTEDQEFASVHSITSSWAISRTKPTPLPFERQMTAFEERASLAGQIGKARNP